MAAVVDIDINEGDTFLMSLDFWSDADNTIPIDITSSVFKGSFQIGEKLIPMVMTISSSAVNVLEASVAYTLMGDLSKQGKYDIDQLENGENFRVIQGSVRVNPGVTT